jgi:hypothetical protein
MKITKDKENLIVSIPLKQKIYNPYDEREDQGECENIVGVIAGDDEQGFYSLNSLAYKDDIQLGAPLVLTYLENDEFIKLCKKLGVSIWEYSKCSECGKTIWGSFTMNDKGNICWDCEYELEKSDTPMGASQWKNHGIKYKYDEYFDVKFKK